MLHCQPVRLIRSYRSLTDGVTCIDCLHQASKSGEGSRILLLTPTGQKCAHTYIRVGYAFRGIRVVELRGHNLDKNSWLMFARLHEVHVEIGFTLYWSSFDTKLTVCLWVQRFSRFKISYLFVLILRKHSMPSVIGNLRFMLKAVILKALITKPNATLSLH